MTALPARKPTNISLDAKLLAEARELDVNVSRACEVGLADEVRKRRWAKWQEDNREAIEEYNARVERTGLASEYFHDFGNGLREDKSPMAQFDVFDNPVVSMRREQPYLLEVQSDLLGAMVTTVVIPLVVGVSVVRFERLMPALEFQGASLRMSTPELFSLPRRALGPPLANLSVHRDAIVAALDHLILGL